MLLLDEPFNALDEASVAQVTALLHAKADAGVTIVMTSHHPTEITAICDSILTIDNGHITQDHTR